ncbi:VanW family protein [Brevibacillus ruminantium]|uniref:VanW family protein n=1 Tax=Brevibacillus ruminantium TaxID=2950604 RepID=A0ABY4WC81_9BACL|nr:VanW family protein [Brevibacillus ruminantium]USG64672.1 VanW family protein [Brevibacillus ruminantium]
MVRKKQFKLMGKVWTILLIQSCVFGVAALLASGLWERPEAAIASRLPDLRVAGVSLEGMTMEQARNSVQESIAKLSDLPIVLTKEQTVFSLDKDKLGIRFEVEKTWEKVAEQAERSSGIRGFVYGLTGEPADRSIPLAVVYDRSELIRQVTEIARKVEQQAEAATLRIEQNRALVVPEMIGYRVNVEKTVADIENELQLPRTELRIPLQGEKESPAIVSKDLENSVHLLAEWTAPLNTAVPDRFVNVKQAASLLNGTILLPNQVLSFNEKTGPYTEAKGYHPSASPKQDTIPDGLGGSAAQVASALFETSVLSGLDIIERHQARRPVDFQRLGMEAVVNGRDMDLRVANRQTAPVYIHAVVEDSRLRVALFGGAASSKEKPLLLTDIDEHFPPDTIVRADRSLVTNQERIVRIGENGLRAKVYLYFPQADKKVLVADNLYPPIPNVVAVGPQLARSKRTDNTEADWPLEAGAEDWSENGTDWTPDYVYGDQGEYLDGTWPGGTESSSQASSIKPPDIDVLPGQPSEPVSTGGVPGAGGSPSGTVEKKNGVIILHDAPVR